MTGGRMDARRTHSVSPAQRIARGIAIVVLLPFRLVWEGLKLLARAIDVAVDRLLTVVVIPVGRFLRDRILRPIATVVRDFLLRPVGRALAFLWWRGLAPAGNWILRMILDPIWNALWRFVLRPIGVAVAVVVTYAVRYLIIAPAMGLWRWILAPLWRGVRTVLGYAWRATASLVRVLIVDPYRFVHRTTLRPIGAGLAATWRLLVVRPAAWIDRTTVRPARRWLAETMPAVFGR
ncbi:Uncharacterised protein [Nocardia otitidiscaviarum]|uniref:Uncharacterized protein n=1 Tax=Nocardia otitidiscaviarum TaxID=1823 RepID=A0A379JL20_9NOCA|nr:hypothetical protein [Nocardia otitidiscaviarum]SUD49218.1 Uncharacterised protein [Nocardia otitidiscaviarum]